MKTGRRADPVPEMFKENGRPDRLRSESVEVVGLSDPERAFRVDKWDSSSPERSEESP